MDREISQSNKKYATIYPHLYIYIFIYFKCNYLDIRFFFVSLSEKKIKTSGAPTLLLLPIPLSFLDEKEKLWSTFAFGGGWLWSCRFVTKY
jgi:hypothetical protein